MGRASVIAALMATVMAAGTVHARADVAIPGFWDEKERVPRPDISELSRLRFLTTVDFAPFNFVDSRDRLTGFHVDLARAICAELEMTDRCQIQALPWEELDGALESGQGEAIIAGLAVTEANREKYLFSRAYLQFPARFVMQRGQVASEPLHEELAGRRVGVLDDTAHELFLRTFFPDVRPVVYTRSDWLRGDLKDGNIAAVLGDGMRLSFWLAGTDSEDCCAFAGGPYLAPEYLGRGLAIAVSPEMPELAAALDYALREIDVDGTFAELYLRYFPVSFY